VPRARKTRGTSVGGARVVGKWHNNKHPKKGRSGGQVECSHHIEGIKSSLTFVSQGFTEEEHEGSTLQPMRSRVARSAWGEVKNDPVQILA